RRARAAPAPRAGRADVDRAPLSRKLPPADAEIYSVMLRNAEQWKMLTSSNAWAKLTDLEGVQMAWQQVQKQLNDPKNPIVQFFKAKENQELLELLGDMVSNEVFFYSPAGFSDFLQLMSEIQGARIGEMFAMLGGGQPPQPEEQLHSLLTALKDHKGKLQLPSFVWGFRLEDTKRAKAQLDRL